MVALYITSMKYPKMNIITVEKLQNLQNSERPHRQLLIKGSHFHPRPRNQRQIFIILVIFMFIFLSFNSTDSGWDNPFRPDGDLSREADEIVNLIKGKL